MISFRYTGRPSLTNLRPASTTAIFSLSESYDTVGLAVRIVVRRIVALDLAAAIDALAIPVAAVQGSIVIVVEGVVAGQFGSELAACDAVTVGIQAVCVAVDIVVDRIIAA